MLSVIALCSLTGIILLKTIVARFERVRLTSATAGKRHGVTTHERPSVILLTAFIIALLAIIILARAETTHRRLSETTSLKSLLPDACWRF